MTYSIVDLVDALVDSERYKASPALADDTAKRARALEKAFEVNLDVDSCLREQRNLLYLFRNTIRVLAELKTPFDGILEGHIALPELEWWQSTVSGSADKVRADCRSLAQHILRTMYPASSDYAPTSEDLLKLGFDDKHSLDPKDFL